MTYGKPTGKSDDFQTPAIAWETFEKGVTLQPGTKVWCPFFFEGDLTWNRKGLIHENKDFFQYEPPSWDCIVDNPPFTMKKEVLERCLKLGKPFSLLLPVDTLERKYFWDIMQEHNDKFTVIIPSTRFNFMKDKRNSMFKSCWFCFGFNLGKQFIWV